MGASRRVSKDVTSDGDASASEAERDPDPPVVVVKKRNWRDWCIRGFFTIIMIGGFAGVIWLGPPALMCLILFVQMMCFKEIISIGHVISKEKKLPWFRTLNWYFLFASNYYFYGHTVLELFVLPSFPRSNILQEAISKHKFVSFIFYMTGFVLFVLSLKKGHYKFQFGQFAWTHITLMIIVTQSQFVVYNIFQGFIWFLLPVSFVICNDIMAYMFGFFFGRTRLIQLSPKKTWEGFIGAFFSTVAFAFFLSKWLSQFPYFTCPITDVVASATPMSCSPSLLYQPANFVVPEPISDVLFLMGFDMRTVTMLPIQLHSLVLAVFASIIAPFGGFFASGFKRAFKIKDFGDTIPGHGGLTDRFDCQYLMATFAFVYHSTFVASSAATVASITAIFRSLSEQDQIVAFEKINDIFVSKGLAA